MSCVMLLQSEAGWLGKDQPVALGHTPVNIVLEHF